jgi:hypothetical protein
MWKIEVHANDKKRTLLPRDVPQDKRKARTGSFEVILSWTSAGEKYVYAVGQKSWEGAWGYVFACSSPLIPEIPSQVC